MKWPLLVLVLCLGTQTCLAAPGSVVVRGLFDKAVLLEIDGQQRFLRVGERDVSGMRLIYADPLEALVEIDGVRKVLKLNNQVGARYQAPVSRVVVLRKNTFKEYRSRVTVNGKIIEAVLDTGANTVAMSSQDAERLGIRYALGEPTQVATASGVSHGWSITLDSIEIGEISAYHVAAVVIEGNYPHVMLLGMSFLEHVDMQEKNNILTLSPRHH
jgi:aspartyl protease family protein